jgi:hypothetical protein
MSLLQLDHSARSLQLHQIFEAAKRPLAPKRDLLITYRDGMDEYHAMSDTLTIAMCRNIRKSIMISSGLTIKIAHKFPEKSVLLINTYAGAELLVESFARGMYMCSYKLPPQFKGLVPEATHEYDYDENAEAALPTNFRVLDVPCATLTPQRLEAEIRAHQADVVILNAFEFAAFSDKRKKALTEGILEVRHKLNLTMFVFSHEMRLDALPYSGGRGPIGIMSAFAGSIWRLLEDWEKKKWVKRLQNEGSS